MRESAAAAAAAQPYDDDGCASDDSLSPFSQQMVAGFADLHRYMRGGSSGPGTTTLAAASGSSQALGALATMGTAGPQSPGISERSVRVIHSIGTSPMPTTRMDERESLAHTPISELKVELRHQLASMKRAGRSQEASLDDSSDRVVQLLRVSARLRVGCRLCTCRNAAILIASRQAMIPAITVRRAAASSVRRICPVPCVCVCASPAAPGGGARRQPEHRARRVVPLRKRQVARRDELAAAA